jgi:hypothetical protein
MRLLPSLRLIGRRPRISELVGMYTIFLIFVVILFYFYCLIIFLYLLDNNNYLFPNDNLKYNELIMSIASNRAN